MLFEDDCEDLVQTSSRSRAKDNKRPRPQVVVACPAPSWHSQNVGCRVIRTLPLLATISFVASAYISVLNGIVVHSTGTSTNVIDFIDREPLSATPHIWQLDAIIFVSHAYQA